MKRKHFLLLSIILIFIILIVLKPKQSIDTSKIDKESLTKDEYYSIVAENFVGGGPSKDGIPAIDNPAWKKAYESDISNDEEVYGYFLEGEPRAIPQGILYWHEIVNEESESGEKLSVTYCPLTGTIIGFKGLNLGVSGSLYNSNLVLYDRATDSEAPQILQTAVDGPIKGERFDNFYVYTTSWGQWKEKYPETLILSEQTGYSKNYFSTPYPGYEDALRIWFPVAAKSDLFHSKKIIHGVENNDEFLAIPKSEFKNVESSKYNLGGDEINLEYDKELDVIKAYNNGEQINSFDSYWFAWYAYHPDTKVFNI